VASVVNRTNWNFAEGGNETGPHDNVTISVSAGTGRKIVAGFSTTSAGTLSSPVFDAAGANLAMTIVDDEYGTIPDIMLCYVDLDDSFAAGTYTVGCTSSVAQRVGACAWQLEGVATGAAEAATSDFSPTGDNTTAGTLSVTNGAVVVSGYTAASSGDTATVNSAEFTITAQAKGTSFTPDANYMADGIADATESVTITWTESGNSTTSAVFASFAAAGGAPPSTRSNHYQRRFALLYG
jgi:hypothetical protein